MANNKFKLFSTSNYTKVIRLSSNPSFVGVLVAIRAVITLFLFDMYCLKNLRRCQDHFWNICYFEVNKAVSHHKTWKPWKIALQIIVIW